MSEVRSLIVMIMSGSGMGGGEGRRGACLLGRKCLFGGRYRGRVQYGESCHISCNPSSPALKTLAVFLNPRSLLLWQPHRRPSKPDTPPITPYPSSPWLFVMAWLGLFRGKLTMSGISEVTEKMKLRVAAQKEVWGDRGGDSHQGSTSMQSDTRAPIPDDGPLNAEECLLYNLLFASAWLEDVM